MSIEFQMRYEGRDATAHQLDMRLLGRSLIGLDRAIHQGLYVALVGHYPRRRQRLELSVQVGPPRDACVDISGIVAALPGVLPIAHELLVNMGSDYISHFLSYLLCMLGGKPKEAEPHFIKMVEALMEVNRQFLSDRQDERATVAAEAEAWRRFSLDLVERMRPTAAQIVAPVGPTCETLTIGARGDLRGAIVDAPMADVIRSKEIVEVGDMATMIVRVDGITLHNRTLKVESPEEPGRYIVADVRDPTFDLEPNPYVATVGTKVMVDVKPMRRLNGELVKLYIMNLGASAQAA